jgi:hypothetical protein
MRAQRGWWKLWCSLAALTRRCCMRTTFYLTAAMTYAPCYLRTTLSCRIVDGWRNLSVLIRMVAPGERERGRENLGMHPSLKT